jgi:hypothetical protein
MSAVLKAFYRGLRVLRHPMNRIGFRRERWPRAFVLINVMGGTYSEEQSFNKLYESKVDPWNYDSDPRERARYRLAENLLSAAQRGRYKACLEVG